MSEPHLILPHDLGRYWYFNVQRTLAVANQAQLLPAFLRELDSFATKKQIWLGCYVSFEAGLAMHGLLLKPAPAPLACLWQLTEPQNFAGAVNIPANLDWQPEWSFERYCQAFASVSQAIQAGDIYQMNLTLRAQAYAKSWQERRLADLAARAALVLTPELKLWSASPECFLRFSAKTKKLATCPIKGTIAKVNPFAFAMLQANPKEQAEHVMVVDMCRNDLGRVCTPGSVAVDALFARRDLAYATHMESCVYGQLQGGINWSQILSALLPAASISGTPKLQACKLIQQIETSPRGPYTGILGWIAPAGDAYFSILIRSAWQSSTTLLLQYGAGGGIVADSQAEHEYAELLLKLRAFANNLKP